MLWIHLAFMQPLVGGLLVNLCYHRCHGKFKPERKEKLPLLPSKQGGFNCKGSLQRPKKRFWELKTVKHSWRPAGKLLFFWASRKSVQMHESTVTQLASTYAWTFTESTKGLVHFFPERGQQIKALSPTQAGHARGHTWFWLWDSGHSRFQSFNSLSQRSLGLEKGAREVWLILNSVIMGNFEAVKVVIIISSCQITKHLSVSLIQQHTNYHFMT